MTRIKIFDPTQSLNQFLASLRLKVEILEDGTEIVLCPDYLVADLKNVIGTRGHKSEVIREGAGNTAEATTVNTATAANTFPDPTLYQRFYVDTMATFFNQPRRQPTRVAYRAGDLEEEINF